MIDHVMNELSIKVLRISQPLGEFYIGSIDSNTLLSITRTDVRKFTESGNPGSIDGIQRELSNSRLKDLREYVNLDYATFPTSVILAIDHRCVELKECCDHLSDVFYLKVKPYDGHEDGDPIPIEQSALIIDGQHRLAGLKNRDTGKGPFQVNVSIFVGADIADQAEIFGRVNLAQTKVNKSLAYDLFTYAKEKSPYKVAHDIVLALNNDIGGPFHHRIKRLGVNTPGIEGEMLAQATVVNGLLRHLPPYQERERSKSLLQLSWKREEKESWRQRIFVDFYREDEFVNIFLNVSNFFEAVSDKWPAAWNNPQEGQILARTTGYNALIRFLKDVFLELAYDQPRIVKKSEFADVFDKINIDETSLNKEIYIPGSTGQGLLYRHLKEGLEEWKKLQTGTVGLHNQAG